MNANLSSKLKRICEENGVETLSIFGSSSRNDSNEDSDVDLLVKYSKSTKNKTLIDHLAFQDALSSVFNKKVDLVENDYLSPKFKNYIMKDVKSLYAERS